jgi:serine/threonine protein kinase
MASIDVALRLGNSNMKNGESTSVTVLAAKNDDNFPIMDENFEYHGYHKFGRILGRGSFGTVIECIRKIDSRPVALKLVKSKAIYKWVPESNLQKLDNNDVDKKSDRLIPIEVACLLRSVEINGVVKLNEYWPSIDKTQCDSLKKKKKIEKEKEVANDQNADETIIGIVLERNYNEECLFDYLNEKNFISENESTVIIKQLVEINVELLSIGVLHGDLKAENILIDRRTKRIKLIDFGSAELIDLNCSSTKAVRTFRGTNLYKPPEYLLHKMFYPRPSTVWTIGIILYNMVTGEFPFQSESEVLEHKTKDILFSKTFNLSNNLMDLIRKCLAFFAADRIIIEKVLVHPFMTQ